MNSPNLSFDVNLASTPVNRRLLQTNDGESSASTGTLGASVSAANDGSSSPDILVTPNPSNIKVENCSNSSVDLDEEDPRSLCVTPPPSLKCSADPHTPTPFKKALAELEMKMGVKPLVSISCTWIMGACACACGL